MATKDTKKEAKKPVVANGVDPNKLWKNITSTIDTGTDYIKSTASKVSGFIESNVTYLKEEVTLENIVGGAGAVWENISKGNWNFFKDWATSEDTPFVAKASAVAASIGGLVVGGIVAGKAAIAAGTKIAASSMGSLLMGSGLTYTLTRQEFVEKAFNFTEKAMEVDFNRTTDKFFADSVKRLQELLKTVAQDLAGLGGRSLARVIVDQTGKTYLEVNRRMLGILSLTMSEEVFEDIKSSLGGIASQLWSLAKDVASEAVLLMGRDWLAELGVPGITKGNDKEEFTLSDKLEKDFKTIADAYKVPDWVREALGEGASEFYDQFRESLTDRAGVIDASRRQQIVFV
ncbi:MAG: hypothetical protein F6K54_16205 [Okeania sp. SIO3B5]|uniref:hypothetical protein n=1 Tax=Okeania sp. SIO3B5 TaxID=2607811 RepID=UPI001401265F|nr:hypothetical protein [Okeania sp. SIO3B5]NEO54487.1 hypothetical protein [Okeania sp. SIO3B5]